MALWIWYIRVHKLINRWWPYRFRVYYGPNRGSLQFRWMGEYRWGCGHCVDQDIGGYADTLTKVQAEARAHAASCKWYMRAVYDEG